MSSTPFDEMYTPSGEVRPHYQDFSRWLEMQSSENCRTSVRKPTLFSEGWELPLPCTAKNLVPKG